MQSCRLRAAFARSSDGRSGAPTAPQLLGTISHAVLEALTETRAIIQPHWELELEALWSRATSDAVGRIAGTSDAAPKTWDGYAIKLARLRKAARRLHEVLAPLGPDAELLTEQSLVAADGRIRGRPDLIARAPGVHWLLDYKTGAVLSRDSREPRESYVRQLRLYAYLQAETTGEWPDRAFLVPLQGSVVEVDIDRTQCIDLARDALKLLEAFNAHAPKPQPPSPAPETCRWCPYAAKCPAFWKHCDEAWAPTVLATAGRISAVTRPRLGGVSLTVDAQAGSLTQTATSVRAVSAEDHPAVADLRAGQEVAFVGLRRDRDTEAFILPESGRAWAWSP